MKLANFDFAEILEQAATAKMGASMSKKDFLHILAKDPGSNISKF